MPIRINLLAEAQAAEEMRRKDPVKRAIWVGGFLVFLVVLWILKVQLDIVYAQNRYKRYETAWTDVVNKYSSVTNNQSRTAEFERKLAQLDRLSTNRFLWAPVLNAMQKSVVESVVVTRIRGEQTYTKEEARMAGSIRVPGAMTERITFSIDAKDLNPGDQSYNKFKEALNQSDFFLKHVGRKDSFVIDGVLSPVTADPADPTLQFVTFTLASRFPETRRSE